MDPPHHGLYAVMNMIPSDRHLRERGDDRPQPKPATDGRQQPMTWVKAFALRIIHS